MSDPIYAIHDLERLIKAQQDVALVKTVSLVNGQSYNFNIEANE